MRIKRKLALILSAIMLVTCVNMLPVNIFATVTSNGSESTPATGSTKLTLDLDTYKGYVNKPATGSTKLTLIVENYKGDDNKPAIGSTKLTLTVSGTKMTPAASDFDYTAPDTTGWTTGTTVSATVAPKSNVTGMGTVTVKYYSDSACEAEATPNAEGTYYVAIDVTEGESYKSGTTIKDSSWMFTLSTNTTQIETITISDKPEKYTNNGTGYTVVKANGDSASTSDVTIPSGAHYSITELSARENVGNTIYALALIHPDSGYSIKEGFAIIGTGCSSPLMHGSVNVPFDSEDILNASTMFGPGTTAAIGDAVIIWELSEYSGNISVTGASLNKTATTLTVGTNETLVATVAPSDATDKTVTWSSSDITVATVDSNGKVTALKAGTAIITVTTTDGNKTATCTVTVSASGPSEHMSSYSYDSKTETVYVDQDTFKSELPSHTVLAMNKNDVKIYKDMKVHAIDRITTVNQLFLASYYAKQMGKTPNIILNYGVYSRSAVPKYEDGTKKLLAWNNLSYKTPGEIYAVCYNEKDGAYLINGSVNSNGTAVFFDFIMRDATNVTIFTVK